ncbi:hypothetical protein EZS27_018646 [termite gut metagenome]|uniref:Outer membrane protein beta-barrel domain-containing protein n=1 Tax=termite gut metagenome TaxID=433724 RepID=A0A5J4RI90_9ZZZZ
MKKFLLVMVIGFMSVSVFAQKGETTVGLNLGYGTKIKSFGIGAKVGYGITDQIRLSPSFNYFLEKDGLSQWEINADLHYLFPLSDKVTVYPLAGVTYTNWKWDSTKAWTEDVARLFLKVAMDDDDIDLYADTYSKGKIGVNLGGGIGFKLTDKLSVGAELKYSSVSDLDQGIFAVNIAYKF